MLTALRIHSIKSADDSSLVGNQFRSSQKTEESSVAYFSHLPTVSQPKTRSEPLQRYLKDTTILIPEYSRSYNSSDNTGSTQAKAQKRMQAILKGYNL